MPTKEQLLNWFTYHAPAADQPERYARLREAGFALAQEIVECTPEGSDQEFSIRLIRLACMTANQAIACEND